MLGDYIAACQSRQLLFGAPSRGLAVEGNRVSLGSPLQRSIKARPQAGVASAGMVANVV